MIGRHLAFATCIICASVASQIPAFTSEYQRQIEAALRETDAKAAADLGRIDQALAAAGPLSRYAVLAENLDVSVARRTLAGFEPIIPSTKPEMISAGTGLIAALFLSVFLLAPVEILRREPPRRRIVWN